MKKNFASPLRAGLVLGLLLSLSARAPAGTNLTRGSISSSGQGSNSGSSASTSQTSTAATTATSQSALTSVSAQRAQESLLRSAQALQALESAQSAARNLSLSSTANNLGTATQPLVTVPDGLAVNGLVPGIKGTDPADPTTIASTIPVTAGANGSASITLAANSALTLPPNATGSSQIIVSGTGTVGSITVGGTIIPLKAGIATTVAPGSTISITQTGGATVTFASGSAVVPSTFSTYTYVTTPATPTTSATTAPVPGSWSGIGGLTQSTYAPATGQTSSPTTVTITQTAQQALLTWQTFNLGKNTTLDFDQSAGGANVGDWVAINKVAANIAPSQILGSIQAPGQVYVINQNGIIFGGSSQVNTGALVASSLPINDNLVSRGLLNNPDLQFLLSQIDIPAGTQGPTPAFDPEENEPAPGSGGNSGGLVSQVNSAGSTTISQASGQDGDVVVQAGAQISSPANSDNTGGKIALIGPNVSNAGEISTPDGQAILAAGLQVGITASSDPEVRGLDVFIGQANPSSSGTALNSGLINAPGANVWITGANVGQLGFINSTTSVSLNGSIDLLAQYDSVVATNPGSTTLLYNPTATGLVTLGPDSVTQTVPDTSSSATVVGTQLALSSEITIQGADVHLASNQAASTTAAAGDGALILAPSGDVTLNAGNWESSNPADNLYSFENDAGQVYLDSGATIDVSGSQDVQASVTQNFISVQLLGPQLADSPLQRDGPLYGQTVVVDIADTGIYDGRAWVGTPLANVSGYVGLIQHTVGQLTTNGGSVAINAGGSVVMQPNSTINVSGGWSDYQGADDQTTKVVSNGKVLDISQATPGQVYQGIYTGYTQTSAKWGVSQSYADSSINGPQYQPGYIQGGDGGSLAITAPAAALDGSMFGSAVSGSLQRQAPPTPGSLSISFQAQTASNILISPTPPDVVFETAANQSLVAPFALDASGNPVALPQDRQALVILSPDLLGQDGFGALSVNNGDGDISVPVNVALTAPPLGSITLSAANLDIEGSMMAPGGALSFTVNNISPYATLGNTPPPANPDRGQFVLGASATLSTAGLIVDDLPDSATSGTLPLVTAGGTIKINAYSADLAKGSTIEASGGVAVSAAGKITYGNGGSISISAGADPNSNATLGGELTLDSTLIGYSGSSGAGLSITAPLIQVGGTTADADTLLLSPAFFSQGGFATFSLTGLGQAVGDPTNDDLPGILIAPGTVIAPEAENWVESANSSSSQGVTLASTLLPEAQRTPVSLSFDGSGVSYGGTLYVRGDFVMGAAASITTDPLGKVSIAGNTATVLGSIVAPGGAISIKGASDSNVIFDSGDPTEPLATVYLGPDAHLSTAGTTVLNPDMYGYATGSVLAGGTITVSGNIVAASGSTLDVSGASGVVYVPPSETTLSASVPGSISSAPVVPSLVDSNGGAITLSGQEELFSDATLIGRAGGPSAVGGSLAISSNDWVSSGATPYTPTPTDPTLVVTQNGPTIPVAFTSGGSSAIGQPVLGSDGSVLAPAGGGHIAVASFSAGGFDNVALAGTVQFNGGVAITAGGTLSVASGGGLFADGTVSLSAPYVVLGLPFQGPLTPTEEGESPFTLAGISGTFIPTSGPGSLTVSGKLIDLGTLSLQGITQANFIAANGDIRGDGSLDVAGSISLTAGQIYPPTDVTFTIAAYDENVVVASSSAGSTAVTLASSALPPGFGVGSPLLGSTVRSINGTAVTLAAGANASVDAPTPEVFDPGSGSVNIAASGVRDLPLSAGGTLNVYASIINQDGVLRAPIGTINLGADASAGTAYVDPVTGTSVDATSVLTLGPQSITSASAVDPTTGQSLIIPYGSNPTGTAWLDPAGNDITAGGVPEKTINIAGAQILDQAGSVVDLSGGGDLSSYTFVAGEGGSTNFLGSGVAWNAQSYAAGQLVTYKGSTYVALQQTSTQAPAINAYWSEVPTSYAVIPGYQASYAPYAPFNSAVGDPGYVGNGLQVGEQVDLGAGSGLPAGIYTLLPAQYALLPGAYLVTPSTTTPTVAQTLPDGSSLVSGYLFNGLSNPGGLPGARVSQFQVESQAVVLSRGQYETSLAGSFLSQGAAQSKTAAPLLPIDAGQLNLEAGSELVLQGTVNAHAPAGGSSGLIDINSGPSEIIEITSGNGSAAPGTLTLDSSELSSFGAGTLLIGGVFQDDGTAIDVEANNVEVDNAGSPLEGSDIILVANDSLTLGPGADIAATDASAGQPNTLQVQGDGALLQVSSVSTASIARSGVTSSEAPALNIGAGATISGASVILNSTYASSLDPSASISGQAVTLGSGQISLQLTNPGSLQPTVGLVLAGPALQSLLSAKSLSLLSYSSIDVYGSGEVGSSTLANLSLDAGEIRGFNNAGGVTFASENIVLGNSAGGTVPGAITAPAGSVSFTADGGTIDFGSNQIAIDQFATVNLNATGGVLAQGSGELVAQDGLVISSPTITGAAGANGTISAGGALTIQPISGASTTIVGGLDPTLTLQGSSVTDNSAIVAQSGNISLNATGAGGAVEVGNLAPASLNAGGTAQVLLNQTKYTSGGAVTLSAVNGNVDVGTLATVNVAAQTGGGNAGTLTISAPQGSSTLSGSLLGQGGAGGQNGAFSLDAGSIGSLDSINTALDAGGFTQSITIRDRTDTNVALDGTVTAASYNLSVDAGSITVNGTINADCALNAPGVASAEPAGNTIYIGGSINLDAGDNVTLAPTAVLNASARNFSNAGQGGSVTLVAGAYRYVDGADVTDYSGSVDVSAGSTIDLRVAANDNSDGSINSTSVAANAALGDFAGTLQIEAPRLGETGVGVQPIDGNVLGASSIAVVANQVYNTAAFGNGLGNISGNGSDITTVIMNNGNNFLGAAGQASATYAPLMASLFGHLSAAGQSVANLEAGSEIVNPTGNITLTSDWDLSTFRFGPNSTPGLLTMRAAGNLVFDGAVSDGFNASPGTLWTATLLAQNTLLPVNAQSWSYYLTAGADFSGANVQNVLPAASLDGAGSLELGINDAHPFVSNGANGTTASAVAGYYQVIRTGSGNITISTGANVELLNQFATIYTAGTQLTTQEAELDGDFSIPVLDESQNPASLGSTGSKFTPGYAAQYSEAGGNVAISAQQDIEHLTQGANGNLVMDSESELPDNWLYRRGDVAASGSFDGNSSIKFGGDPAESTSWWVNFSNFFEGVGALGGGNVTMMAGGDVANVDAVVPTNARMTNQTTLANGSVSTLTSNQTLVQLGGGNLLVEAGDDINAGVYYVENGQGTLRAGNQILTNSTRAPVGGQSAAMGDTSAPSQSWLPTTLFVGEGSFNVTAGGNVLLGPVVNPFLLPEGLGNSVWYKTYFSTYAPGDAIDVASLGGSITFQEEASVLDTGEEPLLQIWLENMDLMGAGGAITSRADYQPWLRLNEESVDPFTTVAELMPPALLATAFSGDINVAGNLLLSPSPVGTIDLAAFGSINGFQSEGSIPGGTAWTAATIDLSDSNPASIPGVASPIGYQEVPGVGTVGPEAAMTGSTFLDFFDTLFDATTTEDPGIIQTEQALHASDTLHANDTTPVELSAATGDITGVELYSPTETDVMAGADITDISLYLQNDSANEISVVSAGGNLVPYDPSSPAREAAQAEPDTFLNSSLAGDIQIAGPGTLEVLAGGNLDLGGQGPGGASNSTGDGISSIGNTLNPALPFAGADIVGAAGIGSALGLGQSQLAFPAFIAQFVMSSAGATYLGELSDLTGATTVLDAASFSALPTDEQDLLALDVFYLALRDAGRDHNDATSSGFGNYASGLSAIATLFPAAGQAGNIDVTSRDIKTESGGNISLLAPNGQITVGLNSSEGDDVTNLGIVTQDGGNISIFAKGDVNVGTSRIFTLRGGNEIIWSSTGNIDAGASSKTVQSAPPTRVIVDPQSADVKTDLAGLATGGGIGVLATVAGVPPGDVDLIAPTGVVNAGEAGIRATGNLNIAAVAVLNAGNISVGGASHGLPPPAAAPNVAGLTAASSAVGAANSAANNLASQLAPSQFASEEEPPSIITVEVIGYGGGDPGN